MARETPRLLSPLVWAYAINFSPFVNLIGLSFLGESMPASFFMLAPK
jgi:hypothetical protein